MTRLWQPSWGRFVHETTATLSLFLFVTATLTLLRFGFVIRFSHLLSPQTGAGDLVATCMHGLRFDARIATLVAGPVILTSAVAGLADVGRMASRLRRALAYLYIGITPFLGCVAAGYYAEFGRPFGLNIFELVYDDTWAILRTLAVEYGLLSNLLFAATASALALAGFSGWQRAFPRRFLARAAGALRGWHRGVLVALLLVLLAGAARGSFEARPAMRKWSAVTADPVLNDAVMSPWAWLIYAFRDRARLERTPALEALLPDRDVRAAAQRFFGTDAQYPTLDDYFARRTAGPKGEPPAQIFLIIMESYDIWPLMDSYRQWGASEQLWSLAQRGLFVDRFLPGAESTMATLAALLVGLPDAGLFTARQATARETFSTSLAAVMSRLGYITRLYYGGMLSWQRLGAFAEAQGFGEVYGRSHMAPALGSVWGLADEQLFALVRNRVRDDQPSLNVILTLSNHPPYDLDLEGMGYDPPADIVPTARLSPRHLGHLWYADRQLGEFVSHMESRYPGALFLLTGDHYSRRHPAGAPSFYERSAVPLVLYGPRALHGVMLPANAVGSHIDIMPTLVELCAPAGFAYAAVGRDLLAPAPAPLGFGRDRVIGAGFILDLGRDPVIHPLPGSRFPVELDLATARARYNDLQAIAWWRIMRGVRLPP